MSCWPAQIPDWIGWTLSSLAIISVLTKDVLAECDSKESKSSQVKVSSFLRESDKDVEVVIAVRLPPKWSTYSVTQPLPVSSGGPMRTRITLDQSPRFHIQGQPTAKPKPTIVRYEELWPKLDVEIHKRKVVWSIPIKLSGDVDITDLTIKGSIEMQVEDSTSASVIKRCFETRRN